MTILISYCSAATGLTVELEYNDVTHVIDNYDPSGPSCSPGVLYGTEVYRHTQGSTIYIVRVKNTAPYGYITTEPVPGCTVDISSATPTNATNDQAADGAITVSATGNGTLEYALDAYAPYQPSNVFTGLPPRTYRVRARNTHAEAGECFDTETVVVSYNALAVCDLVLGNVNTTPGPGGTLTIQDYQTTHLDQPVQYRLDAGSWQDSPVFTGLASGTYNVQIRFKNFTTCTSSRNVTLSSCNLVITAVKITHEQSKYADDAIIEITATTTNTPMQYSINDGGAYQSSNTFSGLAPGTYPIRVKDNLNCEAFMSVEVQNYKAPLAEFPQVNGNRMVITSGPDAVLPAVQQNFDNTLFQNMRFVARERCRYFQKWKTSDQVYLQWRSSYAAHTVKIYNLSNALQATLTAFKRTNYFDKTEALSANFSNYGSGKTQIWFPAGLPNFFEIGQDVTISGQASLNGTYEIVDIVPGTGAALGYQSLLVVKTYTSGTDPLTGTVTITYDVEDYEVWETIVDWSALAAGQYYLKIEGTDEQFTAFAAQSEPVETVTDVSELVLIAYRNVDNAFKIEYSTGITHRIRFEGEVLPAEPGGEKEEMEDSRRRIVKLREYVARMVQLNAYEVPPYVAEKIRLALAHDTVEVNDVLYQPADPMTMNLQDPTDPLSSIAVRLRQVDFLAENADDAGDVDGTVLELDQGEIMELEP